MNEAAAGEYALPLGTVVQCCLDTEMLQWLFVFLTLPLLIERHTGQLCALSSARCSWVHFHQYDLFC